MSAGFGALKNEFSMFWSTSVPNFMLVDKTAQYPPKKSLRAWTKTKKKCIIYFYKTKSLKSYTLLKILVKYGDLIFDMPNVKLV